MRRHARIIKHAKVNKQSYIIQTVAFLAAVQVIFVTIKINRFIPSYSPSSTLIHKQTNGTNKQKLLSIPQRVFTPYQYKFPCYQGVPYIPKKGTRGTKPKPDQGKELQGLIYVKIPKTASSTTSGINLRIANRHGYKLGSSLGKKQQKCAATYLHHTSLELDLTHRNKKKAFVWTYIRQTKPIIISNFFFSSRFRKNYIATFNDFKEYAENPLKYEKQFKFLQTKEYEKEALELNRNEIIQEILDDYDFIGVTERFDESLVALRFLLGLDAGDILYVPAKLSGGYDSRKKCNKIPDKIKWPELNDYYSSSVWKKNNALMDDMYAAVNRSLDLTIENIGKDKFNAALDEHKRLLKLGNEVCGPKAIFPCSKDGISQRKESKENCYYKDHGCGYACLDELYLKEMNK